MQLKLDQEKQKESFLAGGKSSVQASENFAKLRADALKASTSEPSKSKEPGLEGVFWFPPIIHIRLASWCNNSFIGQPLDLEAHLLYLSQNSLVDSIWLMEANYSHSV